MRLLPRLLITALAVFSVSTVQAGFFDKLKEKASNVLDKVKDAKETVSTSKEVVRETDSLTDSVQYYDSYSPSPAEIRLMQSRLNELGYDVGRPDGRMGKRTREAVKLYQSNTNVPANGSIDYSLFQSIISRQGPQVKSQSLSRSEWKQYQQMLNDLGYNAGKPDGLPGKRTRNAINIFLAENKLPPSGGQDRVGFESINKILSGEQNHSKSDTRASADGTEAQHAVIDSEPGALYRTLMLSWLKMHQSQLPNEVLAAAYVYAFEGYERKSHYCKALVDIIGHKGNAIQAKNEAVEFVGRYEKFLDENTLPDFPRDIEIEFFVKAPYDDYDFERQALKLRSNRWEKDMDLADGRAGIDFSACNAMLKMPAKAQVKSNLTAPEAFEFSLNAMVRSAVAKNNDAQAGDTSLLGDGFEVLHRIKMSQDNASQLLDQSRKTALLKVNATVRIDRNSPLTSNNRPNTASKIFSNRLIKMSSVDVNTGIPVHDIDLGTSVSDSILSFEKPMPSPPESGLPDGLAYFEGAIVVLSPDHGIRKFPSTPETQLALRRLEQKIVLQSHPQLANDPSIAIHFADLAGPESDKYLTKRPMFEAVDTPTSFKWADMSGGGEGSEVVVGWKPTNDTFEADRLRQAFAEEFSTDLLGEPIKLPLEFVQLKPISINTYDLKRGGFPLTISSSQLVLNIPQVNTRRSLSAFDMSDKLKALVPFKRFPELWKVPADQAEAIQADLKFRRTGIFESFSDETVADMILKNPSMQSELARSITADAVLATRMRITGLKHQPSSGSKIGRVVLDMDLVSLTLYEGQTLDREIGRLTPPENSVLASVESPQWSADDIKRLEPDNFRLLYLKDGNTEGLSEQFWNQAAEQRRLLESLLGRNSWSSFQAIKPYWGTVFPKSVVGSRIPLSADQVRLYKEWSIERGGYIGDQFIPMTVTASVSDVGIVSTKKLGERVKSRLIGMLGNHGIKANRVSEKIKKSMRQTGLDEAMQRFPDSSDWAGVFIGEDLVTGVALKSAPAWFEQNWVSESIKLKSGEFNAQLIVRVDELHRFVTPEGKPGIVLSLSPDSLQYTLKDGKTVFFTPNRQSESEPKTSRKPLDILGVSIGDSMDTAIEVVKESFGGAVTIQEIETGDSALPHSIRVQLEVKAEKAPESIVDLFVDREQSKVIAVGRHISYGKLGISTQQVSNSLVERYGPADGKVIKKSGGSESHYLGWGQGAATSAKLKNTSRLYDDCILYPYRNYKARNKGRISTGELKSPCGTYLLSYITDRGAVILLLDTIDTLGRRAEAKAKRLQEETQKLEKKADAIKF